MTIVDDIDSDLDTLKWHVSIVSNLAYAERVDVIDGNRIKKRMHRVILSRILERQLLPEEVPDHKDNDGLNNTRSNLRLATRTQNKQNRRMYKNNTSGYKGVCRDLQSSRWMAYIGVNGKIKHLGSFADIYDAALAYNKAALFYHGEFAHTNDLNR